MDPELLKILACPACVTRPTAGKTRLADAALELQGQPDAPTGLKCRHCGRIYKIEGGIPNMLVDEATLPTAK